MYMSTRSLSAVSAAEPLLTEQCVLCASGATKKFDKVALGLIWDSLWSLHVALEGKSTGMRLSGGCPERKTHTMRFEIWVRVGCVRNCGQFGPRSAQVLTE